MMQIDLETISEKLGAVEDIKALLDGLFALAPVGFAICDSAGYNLVANQAFLDLFGSLPPPDYSLLRDEQTASQGLREMVLRSFAGEVIRTPVFWFDPRDVEHVSVEQGNRVAISMSTFPIRDREGAVAYVVASYRDHTQEMLALEQAEAERDRLRALHAEREALEAQLRQAQKMEAVGQLAGSVAHDFNNLLTVINGFSELLMAERSADNPELEALQQIYQAGQQAAALTSQLLAFGRKSILKPIAHDLNQGTRKLENMLRRLLPEDIALSLELAEHLDQVEIDPSQFEQVIMNLVLNARDALPQGGLILIRTANVRLDEHYDQTHAEIQAGAYVMLTVSDNGLGMDAATSQRIFEPFFTTKSEGKGTGLGLSTVHGIVRQSGGYIFVYSEPGHGTSFKLYFPARAVANQAPAPQAPETLPEGGETILLVEDVAEVRSYTRTVLESCGYRVLEAASGPEALAKFADTPCDLLVSDVIMPKMSGPRLSEALQALRPGLKVLYLSGYTDDAVLRYGILASDIPFLAKPFTPSQLARKVREVLDSELADA